MTPQISVIIPPYKRPATLLQTLDSLQSQTLDGFDIIVVDNAAEQDIERRISQFKTSARVPARYIAEPHPGVTFARHAGARASTAELLVFADDDVICVPGLIAAYAKAFHEHPDMAAAGGPMHLNWEAPPPEWLVEFIGKARLFPMLGFFDLYDEFHLGPRGVFFSGNMAIRRKALFEVGGFNPELLGDSYVGDGEVGLYRKLWDRGLLIGYVPGALMYHHVPADRMSVDFFRRRMANEGISDIYTHYHGSVPERVRLLRHAAFLAVKHNRLWAKARLHRGRTDKASVQLQIDAARTWSQWKYVLRLILDNARRRMLARRDWLNVGVSVASLSGPASG